MVAELKPGALSDSDLAVNKSKPIKHAKAQPKVDEMSANSQDIQVAKVQIKQDRDMNFAIGIIINSFFVLYNPLKVA